MSEQVNQDTSFITKFNSADYELTVALVNEFFNYPIPNGIVRQFSITDSIYSVFPRAFISVDNTDNALEDYSEANTFTKNKLNTKSFQFLGSGRDYFYVDVKPVANKLGEFLNTNELRDDAFRLKYVFCIVDEDEITDPTQRLKTKNFQLVDVREYLLLNKSDLISSSQILGKIAKGLRLGQLSDEGRAVKTGDLIKEILITGLTEYDSNISSKFAEDWDEGYSSLFYSSPPDFKLIESLEYVLDAHVSKTNLDNCILKLERDNTFSLRSLSEYFNKAYDNGSPGQFVIDIFHTANTKTVQNVDNEQNPDTNLTAVKGQLDKNSYSFQIDSSIFVGLENFSFINITGVDGSRDLISTAVHSYDYAAKEFLVEQRFSNIEDTRVFFYENYIKPMGGHKPYPIFPLNETKKKNAVINNTFSTYTDFYSKLKEGRNKTLSRALDFATGISFTTEGFPHRRPGRFVTIVNDNALKDSVYQNIINGEWFITECTHIFQQNTYVNNLICIKPYTFMPVETP